jgi:wobble nucleotide-excising tRNase
MITKTAKLNKFGIFHNFKWNNDIPEFKKFNLIYGWNRSGKTTFSRVFSACEKKSTTFKQYPKDGKFEIKSHTGTNIKSSEIENCSLPIKVFNHDFIDENISFDPSDTCNPIVYVSEEDIESRKKLGALKQDNRKLTDNFERSQKEKIKSEAADENFRISTAQNIKTTIGNLKVRDKYYDYDKSNLKTVLDDIGIDNFSKLSDKDFNKYKQLINSEAKQEQIAFSEYELNFIIDNQSITSFANIHLALEQLLSKKIISEILERLKDDQDLSNWVKQGFDLHKQKEEVEKCLFCQKPLDDGFLKSLSKHFSKDYENLQSNITIFVTELENLKKEKYTEKNSDLYSDLLSKYQQEAKNINDVIDKLNKWINEATNKLQEKFKNPLSIINLPKKPENYESACNKIIDEFNMIIKRHNEKVNNHEREVETAKEKLEHHLISIAICDQNYKQIKLDSNDSIEKERKAKEKLQSNENEIKTLERKTSNIGKALQKINKHLEEFFGRKEIQLELDAGKKGYIIKRDDLPASNLSEGEKTAIAFSYFIVKAQERDFNVKEGIIFIDDPISSFDINFIYHCFSIIKNHFKNTGQLFISTHNFELFNLVKEWYRGKNRRGRNGDICEFYMIENSIIDNKRHSHLKQLEKTLRNFKSEYHFLFARLNNFLNNSSPEYADFYIIGNIARRFLEIFTNFKIPTTGDLFSKLGQLDTKNISDTKKEKVYRLIQEFSHGSDPTSTIEHKDKSESQEAIKVLLDIVKESDSKHYELLEKSLP